MKRFDYGLFIGRFQPFHKGHLHALNFALSLCNNLIIGIGSSQESGTENNPLSSKVRIEIIKSVLVGKAIMVRFIEIPDFEDNDAWFGYIIKKEPKIDVVFSRTRLVKSIFKRHGIAVVSPPWYDRKRLSAAKIREMIKRGRHWQDRVPEEAVDKITAHESAIMLASGNMIEKRR